MGSNRIVSGRAASRAVGLTKPLEKEVQVAAFEYMQAIIVPDLGRALSDFAFAVPNGTMLAGSAKQRAQYMNSLKAQGFKVGVSDVMLALPRAHFHGAFIEIKRDAKSPVSIEQMNWLALMEQVGYWTRLARGLDETLFVLRAYVQLGPFQPLEV